MSTEVEVMLLYEQLRFCNQSKVLENINIVMIWSEQHSDNEHLHLQHVINIK
jgi:hypothetical protein